MYGLMPSWYAWLSTGDITNMVRNNDSPSSTWLGGVACVASAWRRKLSTMMMRVNEVIISSTAGNRVSTVISATTCSDRLQFWPAPAFCTVTSGMPACGEEIGAIGAIAVVDVVVVAACAPNETNSIRNSGSNRRNKVF